MRTTVTENHKCNELCNTNRHHIVPKRTIDLWHDLTSRADRMGREPKRSSVDWREVVEATGTFLLLVLALVVWVFII